MSSTTDYEGSVHRRHLQGRALSSELYDLWIGAFASHVSPMRPLRGLDLDRGAMTGHLHCIDKSWNGTHHLPECWNGMAGRWLRCPSPTGHITAWEGEKAMSRRKSTKNKQAASYLSPGVYVEEVSSGSRPIEGVGTAVAAFVGFARRQPVRAAIAATAILAAVGAAVRAMRH
jgi:hypothetical protein